MQTVNFSDMYIKDLNYRLLNVATHASSLLSMWKVLAKKHSPKCTHYIIFLVSEDDKCQHRIVSERWFCVLNNIL